MNFIFASWLRVRPPAVSWVMVAALSWGIAMAPAPAVALAVADCDALDAERKVLIAAGAAQEMARGPEWAQANLSADRLREVMRFVRVDELVKFRCADVYARAAVADQMKRAEEQTQRRMKLQRERKAAERAAALANVPPLPERNPRRAARKAKKTQKSRGRSAGQVTGAALGQQVLGAGNPPLPSRKPR